MAKNALSPAAPRSKSAWFNQRRVARWLLLILVLCAAFFLPPILERRNAVEVGINWAPDQQQKIVIFEAPKVFGSSQSPAAHIVLQTNSGQELHRLRLDNLHDLQNITWEDKAVIVNGTRWAR